ncbi:MAG: restriction endonuclease, partial [Candidatus Methanomethylophilaceae archaeon]
SVKEFMSRKKKLADYFDESVKGDIFDFIPPQRTNQIFTPKKVVKEMVDMLEKENPGCFNDENKTFADLYMKSGLYLAEIVKRLYRSERLKSLFPDEKDRLNHIFADQIYGLAPTEIIYHITLSFLLGFSDKIEIKKHNIKMCDLLQYAKEDKFEEKLKEVFDF